MINYSRTWRKKGKKRVETLSNTIEMFVNILDRTFEVKPLLVSEFGGRSFVWRVIFHMLWIKK